jgi:2-oxoglutarate ferredoxin oxidoreductase subunit alpha
MVNLRAEKVEKIADHIPEQKVETGADSGELLVLGWGSTYGAIKTAVKDLVDDGFSVSHAHMRYLNPFPKNMKELLSRFNKILIPEINNGQLVQIIRSRYLVDAQPLNKIQGLPFTSQELREACLKELSK